MPGEPGVPGEEPGEEPDEEPEGETFGRFPDGVPSLPGLEVPALASLRPGGRAPLMRGGRTGGFSATAVGENVAPHVRGPVICVCPSGAQSPTNPMNVKPASALGCNSTGTPSGYLTEQIDPFEPQMRSTASMVPPVGTGAIVRTCVVTAGGTGIDSKVAPHVRATVIAVRPPGAQSPV